jgi:metal-responsive CopG/Arc/MetJ family transcriptional regulator
MKETASVVMRVDKNFLERIDQKCKRDGFLTRTEYILYLIRNDVAESRAV